MLVLHHQTHERSMLGKNAFTLTIASLIVKSLETMNAACCDKN